MGNLNDYIEGRGDLRFSEVGLCEVDALILSIISYMRFDGVVPGVDEDSSVTLLEAVKRLLGKNKGKKVTIGKLFPPEFIALTVAAAKSRRFSGIRLMCYENEISEVEEKQFSALTFKITRDKYFVAFRGTDDTLTGWKESFNMSFMLPIPAQREAAEYFSKVAKKYNGSFYLGGHSKGGNLAVYAAAEAEDSAKDRIITIYNNDGPGFDREYVNGEKFRSVQDKILTVVPQSSVVGMLLEHEEEYIIVKSNAGGLLQHDGSTWEVTGGSFVHLDTVTEDSKLIDRRLKEWLDGMPPSGREKFVDTVFETLTATNAKTLTELTSDKLKLVKAWSSLDQTTKNFLLKFAAILIKHNALTVKKKKSK